jgi:HEAT repeat protein
MTVTIEQLRLRLAEDEPDYEALTRLGPSVLSLLSQLVSGQDQYVAANAASLAGMIGGEQAVAVLERAARSPSAQVRTASAAALARVKSPRAAGLIAGLVRDPDKGVRKFAIKAAAVRPNAALAAEIADLSKREPVSELRSLAKAALRTMRKV